MDTSSQITLKSLVIALIAEILLNIGAIVPASINIYSSGVFNYSQLITEAFIIPIIALAIFGAGYDFLLGGSGLHLPEDVIGGFLISLYIITLNPSTQLLSFNGGIAIVIMLFLSWLPASLLRRLGSGKVKT